VLVQDDGVEVPPLCPNCGHVLDGRVCPHCESVILE
jgi:ribosomal protein S27AE